MAVAFTKVRKRQVFGPENEPGIKMFFCSAQFDFGDETYATAGLAFDITASGVFDLSAAADILFVGIEPIGASAEDPTTALIGHYNRTDKKLIGYTSNGAAPALLAEVNNGSTTAFDNVRGRVFAIVLDN